MQFEDQLKKSMDYHHSMGWIAFPVYLYQSDDQKKKMNSVKWRDMTHEKALQLLNTPGYKYSGLAILTGIKSNLLVIDIEPVPHRLRLVV